MTIIYKNTYLNLIDLDLNDTQMLIPIILCIIHTGETMHCELFYNTKQWPK